MNPDFTATTYEVYSYWDARREEPKEIAARIRRYVDGLMELGPLFSQWQVGLMKPRLFEHVRDDLANLVRRDVSRDEGWLRGLWGNMRAARSALQHIRQRRLLA